MAAEEKKDEVNYPRPQRTTDEYSNGCKHSDKE